MREGEKRKKDGKWKIFSGRKLLGSNYIYRVVKLNFLLLRETGIGELGLIIGKIKLYFCILKFVILKFISII